MLQVSKPPNMLLQLNIALKLLKVHNVSRHRFLTQQSWHCCVKSLDLTLSFLMFLVEQRAATVLRQRTVFYAISSVVFQVMLAIFTSSSVDSFKVSTSGPTFPLRCRFHFDSRQLICALVLSCSKVMIIRCNHKLHCFRAPTNSALDGGWVLTLSRRPCMSLMSGLTGEGEGVWPV